MPSIAEGSCAECFLEEEIYERYCKLKSDGYIEAPALGHTYLVKKVSDMDGGLIHSVLLTKDKCGDICGIQAEGEYLSIDALRKSIVFCTFLGEVI